MKQKNITDNFSETIKEIRRYFGIKRDEVFHGVCSKGMACRYEHGEQQPDLFLFIALLDRLGISQDRFEFIFPDSLNEFYTWHKNCMIFFENRDWENLVRERRKIKMINLLNEKLFFQRRDFIDYIIAKHVEKNLKSAFAFISAALSRTVEKEEDLIPKRRLLSTFEWHLLYNKYDLMYQLESENKHEITKKLLNYYNYLENLNCDELKKTYIAPKLVLIFLRNDRFFFTKEERLCLIKGMMKKLISFSRIREMPIFLDLLMETEQALYKRRAYKRQKEALEDIFLICGEYVEFSVETFIEDIKYLVLSDVLKWRRKIKGYTLEAVSDEICDVRTYSRCEKGITSPRKKILRKVADKLEIEFFYFRGEVECEKIENLFLVNECRKLYVSYKMEELKVNLKKLETNIDGSNLYNRQTIEFFGILIQMEDRVEEKIEKLENLLNYTETKLQKGGVYTRKELEIFSSIAYYKGKKEVEEGIKILEVLLENEKKQKTKNYSRCAVLRMDLSGLYEEKEEYIKSKEICFQIIKEMLVADESSLLLNALDNLLTAEKKLGNVEKAERLCRNIFYIAELYERYNEAEKIRQYFEKTFGYDEEWY